MVLINVIIATCIHICKTRTVYRICTTSVASNCIFIMVHLALPLYIHGIIKYTSVYVTGYTSGSMNTQRAWNVRAASPTQRPLHAFCGAAHNFIFLVSL